MNLRSLSRRLFSRATSTRRATPIRKNPLGRPLEALEDRSVPAIITVAATDNTASEAGSDTGTFTFSRDDATGDLTVNYSVTGSATDGTDFTTLSGTVEFLDGVSEAIVTITPTNDRTVEGSEDVILTIQAGAYTIGTEASDTVTIADNDFATISIAATADVSEEDFGQFIDVTLTINSDGTGTDTLAVTLTADVTDASGGTAIDGTDYNTIGMQTVSFSAGNYPTGTGTQTVFVSPIDDNIVENNETVNLVLGNLSDTLGGQASLGNTANQTTILDVDTAVLSVSDAVAVVEGGTLQFAVTLSAPVDGTVTAFFETSLAGTATPDSDFTPGNVLLMFNPLETSIGVLVSTTNDLRLEAAETVGVMMSNFTSTIASRVTLGISTASGTISDNETATVSFTSVTGTVAEGDTANIAAELTIDTTNGTGGPGLDVDVVVDYDIFGGSATPGADFTTGSTFTFASGSTGAVISTNLVVSGLDDIAIEGSENVQLSMTGATPLSVGGGAITFHDLTITDDDTAANRVFDAAVGAQYRIVRNGGNVEIYRGPTGSETLIASGPVFESPLITFNGVGGATDKLVVDLRGGTLPAIDFNGGTGGNDMLRVIGDGASNATYTPSATTKGDGTITTTLGNITFTGLEPVDITGMAVATLNLPGADDLLTINTGFDFLTGTKAALVVTGTSGGVAIEDVAFWKNGTLVIDTVTGGVDGDDTIDITLANNAHTNTNFTINSGTGTDAVNINGAATFTGDVKITTVNIVSSATLTAGVGAGNKIELVVTGTGVVTDGNGVGINFAVENGLFTVDSVNGDVEADSKTTDFRWTSTGTGDLTLREFDAINIAGGAKFNAAAVFDLSAAGNVTQDAADADAIEGGSFRVVTTAGGTVTLANAKNDVDTIAANVDGTTFFNDLDTLTVGTVGASSGIDTNANDLTIVTGDLLTIGDALAGTDNIVATGKIVDLFTNPGAVANVGGVLEANGAAIASDQLRIAGTGTQFELANANTVRVLAVNTSGGKLRFNNGATNLTVGEVTANMTTTTGVTTDSQDATLSAGALALDQFVDVGTAVARFTTQGGVSQTMDGLVTAGSLGVSNTAAGDIDLDTVENKIGTFAAKNTTGFVDLLNGIALKIETVATDGPLFGTAVSGITTTNAKIEVETTNNGSTLDVNQAIASSGGAVTFTALSKDSALTTAAAGTITTAGGAVAVSTKADTSAIDLNGAVSSSAGTVTVSTIGATSGITVDGGVTTANAKVAVSTTGTTSTVGVNSAVATTGGAVSLTTANTDSTITTSAAGTLTTAGGTVDVNSIGNTSAIDLNGAVSSSAGDVTVSTIGNTSAITVDGGVTTTSAKVTVSTTGTTSTVGVNSAVATTGGAVSLTTANTDSAISTSAAGSLTTAAAGTVDVSTTGDTSAVALNGAVSSATGQVTVSTAGLASTLDVNAAVSTTGGAVSLSTGDTGSALTTGAGGDISTNGGTVDVATTGNTSAIDLAGAVTSAGVVTVSTLGSTSGITVGGGVSTNAAKVTISTTGGTSVVGLNGAVSTTGGAVSVTTAGANSTLSVAAPVGSGGGLIDFNTNGQQTLSAAVNASAGNVNLTTSAGGVNQTAGGVSGKNIILTGTNSGDFILGESNDATGLLTANVAGALTFRDVTSLTIRPVADGAKSVGNMNLLASTGFTVDSSSVVAVNAVGGDITVTAGDGVTTDSRQRLVFNTGVSGKSLTLGNVGDPNTNLGGEEVVFLPSKTVPTTIRGNNPVVAPGDSASPIASDPSIKQILITIDTVVGQSFNGKYRVQYIDNTETIIPFFNLESFGSQSFSAAVVQTTVDQYVIKASSAQGEKSVNSLALNGSAGKTNPFIVSPSGIEPTTPFEAPSIAFGDLNGDNYPDLVVANGANDLSRVYAIDGKLIFEPSVVMGFPRPNYISADNTINLDLVPKMVDFYAFTENGVPTFRGGMYVAVRKTPAGGEIVLGAGVGGGPRVQTFRVVGGQPITVNGVTTKINGQTDMTSNFFAFEPSFRGGVTVAAGNINGAGAEEIIVGTGPGGGPRVQVFDGDQLGNTYPQGDLREGQIRDEATLANFFAYSPNFRGGVLVAAGRFNDDDRVDIATAPGFGGGPHIRVFNGSNLSQELASFFAFEPQPTGLQTSLQTGGGADRLGVGSIAFGAATVNTNATGRQEILVGTTRGSKIEARRFRFDAGATTPTVPYGNLLADLMLNAVDVGGTMVPASQLFDGVNVGGFSV